jgi:hypothetical protein
LIRPQLDVWLGHLPFGFLAAAKQRAFRDSIRSRFLRKRRSEHPKMLERRNLSV